MYIGVVCMIFVCMLILNWVYFYLGKKYWYSKLYICRFVWKLNSFCIIIIIDIVNVN